VSLVSHGPALTGGGDSEARSVPVLWCLTVKVSVHGQGRKVEGALLNDVSVMPKQVGSAGATCITAADFTTLAASLHAPTLPRPHHLFFKRRSFLARRASQYGAGQLDRRLGAASPPQNPADIMGAFAAEPHVPGAG
jgi:hypothetical protein